MRPVANTLGWAISKSAQRSYKFRHTGDLAAKRARAFGIGRGLAVAIRGKGRDCDPDIRPIGFVGDSAAQRALAKAAHVGLYALMILMPLSGSMAWFGGVDLAAQGHNVLKIVLLALVALHVLGALYHQFVLKDGLINRMRRAEG